MTQGPGFARKRYTEADANAIIRRAIDRQPMGGEMSREQLVEIASEVGVSEEALAAAEREWEEDQAESVRRAAFVSERRHGFRTQATVYVAVMAAIILFAGFSHDRDLQQATLAMLMIWGAVILGHGLAVLPTAGPRFEARYRLWMARRIDPAALPSANRPSYPGRNRVR